MDISGNPETAKNYPARQSEAELRYGFVGIIVSRKEAGSRIQDIIARHADILLGRLGLPHLDDDRISVITLIIRSDTDRLGSLTGQLGKIPGVTVKSGLARTPETADQIVSPEDRDAP